MAEYISLHAIIGENSTYGHNVIIEDNVVIGNNVVIGHNVVIHRDVSIGDNCKILDGAILGKKPEKASISATTDKTTRLLRLAIGEAVTIGAGCVIYRGVSIFNDAFLGDLATVREDVVIGNSTIIGRGVTIENKVKIGKKTKIESNAYITAFSTIGDYCFIAPGVIFSNDNYLGRTEERKLHFGGPTLKKGARVGAGAVLLPGITIEEDGLVAAASVVTKDVPARKTVIGAPARVLRDVPEEQLIEKQTFYKC